jgi:hypothetical protein
MVANKSVAECFIFSQDAEQQVFCFDERRPELAGLIASKEDDPARFLCVSLEHGQLSPAMAVEPSV